VVSVLKLQTSALHSTQPAFFKATKQNKKNSYFCQAETFWCRCISCSITFVSIWIDRTNHLLKSAAHFDDIYQTFFYNFVFAEAEHYPGLRNIPEKCLRIISDTQSVDRWGHFSSHNGYVLLTFQVFLSRASALAPQANEAVQSCPKKT
jgi:hypothetical protein